MIISCPECSAKFMVENEQFGSAARKVRCGKCAHVWHQDPPTPEQVGMERQVRKEQGENLAKAAADEKAGIKPNLPTVVSGGAPKWLKVACWLVFMANVFAFVLLNKPYVEGLIGKSEFYTMIGDYDTSGIKIQNIKFNDPMVTKDKTTYFFDWAVKNSRQTSMRVPHAKLSLLDADKNLIFATQVTENNEAMAKEGEYVFRSNKLVDETKKGRYVVIDIGNPYEIETR